MLTERLRSEEEEKVRKAAEAAARQAVIEGQTEREDVRLAEERCCTVLYSCTFLSPHEQCLLLQDMAPFTKVGFTDGVALTHISGPQ